MYSGNGNDTLDGGEGNDALYGYNGKRCTEWWRRQ
nr:hypothetical protein [Neisseria meningitidis]